MARPRLTGGCCSRCQRGFTGAAFDVHSSGALSSEPAGRCPLPWDLARPAVLPVEFGGGARAAFPILPAASSLPEEDDWLAFLLGAAVVGLAALLGGHDQPLRATAHDAPAIQLRPKSSWRRAVHGALIRSSTFNLGDNTYDRYQQR